jgi:two-component system, sensor histidine kinase
MRRIRILIVEDEDDSREGLRMLLEASGYDVETADNGIDGLAKLESCAADTAIVDIDLPGMNGYEIARCARRNHALNGVRLIALTGFGRAKDRQAAHDAGFDRHLTKPVSFATLRNEIEQH